MASQRHNASEACVLEMERTEVRRTKIFLIDLHLARQQGKIAFVTIMGGEFARYPVSYVDLCWRPE